MRQGDNQASFVGYALAGLTTEHERGTNPRQMVRHVGRKNDDATGRIAARANQEGMLDLRPLSASPTSNALDLEFMHPFLCPLDPQPRPPSSSSASYP